MNSNLTKIKKRIYDKYSFKISNFQEKLEGKEYDACTFKLNELELISRSSKITPKKVGQFVTFWKRNVEGITVPFHQNDTFDFYIINSKKENRLGQFVFPKSILISKGILKTDIKDGKRGFRVYPIWDTPINKQAEKTQLWQLNYFYEIDTVNSEKVISLYNK